MCMDRVAGLCAAGMHSSGQPGGRNATRSFAIASYSVSAQALSAHGASVDEWSPFVIDGQVSTWIVPCGRTMLSRQAVALTSVVQAPRNPVTFADIRHWERSFGSLIHRLSEAERETRATPYERGAKISWAASLDGSPLACFTSHTLAALLGAASVVGSNGTDDGSSHRRGHFYPAPQRLD